MDQWLLLPEHLSIRLFLRKFLSLVRAQFLFVLFLLVKQKNEYVRNVMDLILLQVILLQSVHQLVLSLHNQSVNQERNLRCVRSTLDELRLLVGILRLVFLELKNSSRHVIQNILLKLLHLKLILFPLNQKEILLRLHLRLLSKKFVSIILLMIQ